MDYRKLSSEQKLKIKTLAELKAVNYEPKSIKQELRDNLIEALKTGRNVFEGIWGYDETVIPEIERALLSTHHMLLLGLRGQAKTRLARMMVLLLDEYIPVVEDSELNDDPMQPLSWFAKKQVMDLGDRLPIAWMHRTERYTEKLATPDVNISDLIGDVDPIKAASLKLSYADERVIHYGLIPRSHRCIFVINELPDLQARIQVGLFNILQEGDIQIRGFKLRLPLDVQFVFTANPEDYTNRGSIVTPLKDRIDSQIITHYPRSIETGRKITQQEAKTQDGQNELVEVVPLVYDLIEQVAVEARKSEYIDAKSGVSARLTISAAENLMASAERRCLKFKEPKTTTRVSDLLATIPSITGKVELVYEGEQEGAAIVAFSLLGKAIRSQFELYFPNPEQIRKQKAQNPYKPIIDWFGQGALVELPNDLTELEYMARLSKVTGLKELVKSKMPGLSEGSMFFYMEFVLHGLSEFSQINKAPLIAGIQFSDLLSSMFNKMQDGDSEEMDEEDNQ
jgi:magnesium chelatase subunit I